MKIGIIDADLLDNGTQFPNLALMKISGYYKNKGNDVKLITNYNDIYKYDKIFLSKVFDYTKIPIDLNKFPHIEYGGTGFYYDKAPFLPKEIEHHKPDYELYKDFVEEKLKEGEKRNKWKYYLDYSIGFTTRGCFRQCSFCVNKRYKRAELHSPVKEFLDEGKKYITLLDDNILACKDWRQVFEELQATNKRFQFKQGIDIRLMTNEKAKILSKSKYIGHYIFAFDHIKDRDLIEEKLKIWKQYTNKTTKLYVLCGYDENNKYDNNFWKQDIINTFERIKILMKYGCLPYIMRYKKYKESPYYGMYINLANWCNQPHLITKMSFREFAIKSQERVKTKECATMKYLNEFESKYPDIAKKYFDMKFENLNMYK